MTKFQQKLQENKNKIKRDKFLASIDQDFAEFLANTEFSGEVTCIKYAAFPKWTDTAEVKTTTRGPVKNWNKINFKTWHELIAILKKFQKVKNYIGWFFIDAEGPYYKTSLNTFLSYIQNISDYCTTSEHYNFGWVGEVDDVGIIIGTNPASSTHKEYHISIWGV
jgi:hypothetical protein